MDSRAKLGLGMAMALAMSSSPWETDARVDLRHYTRAKPKAGKNQQLRGYYARYSHVLSEYVAQKNLAKKANVKCFKGFRKVRVEVPGLGSVWMKSEFADLAKE